MSTATDSQLTSPTNHVFVDFENVHEVDHSVIGSKATSVTLFLGAKNTKLDVALVEKLLEHAASVQLVRLTSSGKNALDFTLAYYVGRAAITDPTGYFHIISKDAGFDPLIQHLKSRHIRARRHDDFTDLSFTGTPKATVTPPAPPSDSMTKVLEHLRKNLTNRPKRKTTLASHLLAHLGKNSTEAEVTQLIEELIKAGSLTVGDKGSVSYNL
jgi:hypothetical protein